MILKLNRVFGLGVAILTLTAGSALAASTSGGLTVYSGPSDSSTQVGEIKGQQTFSIAKRSGDWCEITSPLAGWVACAMLSDAPRTNLGGPSLGVGANVAPLWDPQSDPEVADHVNG